MLRYNVHVSMVMLCVMLTACGGLTGGGRSSGTKSHGPSIHGYGPIHFTMRREAAYQTLQGKGRWEYLPQSNQEVLTYMDYLGYLQVKVNQYFNERQEATKAEVVVMDARNRPTTLNECRGFHNTVFDMLRQRYGYPDWEPRVNGRRFGESGLMIYTFADSSNISLTYDYVARDRSNRDVGLCTVKLSFNPPWV